jgi:hypothetical protein
MASEWRLTISLTWTFPLSVSVLMCLLVLLSGTLILFFLYIYRKVHFCLSSISKLGLRNLRPKVLNFYE